MSWNAVPALELTANSAEIDRETTRAAEAELLGDWRGLAMRRRDPHEPAAWRQLARQVRQRRDEERRGVEMDPAAERRVRHDQIEGTGRVVARIAGRERRGHGGGIEVRAGGGERGGIEI